MRKLLYAIILCLSVGTNVQSGETIRVLLGMNRWAEKVKELIPTFEKETGIKVDCEIFHEDQLSQKLAVELTAGTDVDVFVIRPQNETKLFGRNGWCLDLTPILEKDAEFDWEDITPGARDCVTYGGKIVGVPTSNETHVICYRRDLFEKHGVEVPTTLEEFEEAARQLTDRDNDFYGIALRGQKAPVVTQFASFLYSMGGDWFDRKTNTATFNSPEALAAIDYFGRMARLYGPPGVLNNSWPQNVALYQQGRVAMYLEASATYPNLLDSGRSPLAAVTGMAPFPAGPAGPRPFFSTAWALSIYSKSKKADAAWRFVRYFSDKKMATYMQGEVGYQGARISAFVDPAGTKNIPAELLVVLATQASYGVGNDRPQVIAVQEARDLLGEAVVVSIQNGDYKAAANTANAKFQALLDRERDDAK